MYSGNYSKENVFLIPKDILFLISKSRPTNEHLEYTETFFKNVTRLKNHFEDNIKKFNLV